MTLSSTGHELQKNLSFTDVGRVVSIVGGGALAAYGLANGLRHRSIPSLALAVVGGGMAYQAVKERVAHQDASTLAYKGGVVVEEAIAIDKPADELFAFWRKLENLPSFMEHLVSVTALSDKTSHWVAKGPGGMTVEWDAEIINEIPGELIAWKSVSPSNIDHAGSVRFTKTGGTTMVTVHLRYDMPGHIVGASIAKLFGEEPGFVIEQELFRLKQLMETGSVSGHQDAPTPQLAARDMQWPRGENPVKDHVAEASEDSFPASDPPSSY
jgi:uncharacterized membrane protein